MDVINLQNVAYNPSKSTPWHSLTSITCALTFGKAYLLDGWQWDGGETLSWIIGGVIEPSYGKLSKNGSPYVLSERQDESWCIRKSTVKAIKFPFRQLSVRDYVRHGLKTAANSHFKSEEEIVRQFMLTPERYKRPLRTLSHEQWRASCAIGAAHGKKIYCFPYLGPDFVNRNYPQWFKRLIDLLKDIGALVLVPTTAIGVKCAKTLFDQAVTLRPNLEEDYDCEDYRFSIRLNL
jgi:hypothetical protein